MKPFIANPCHQNWYTMSPTEKGRFCQSCTKEVIDFSKMSDETFLEFFKEKKTGLCGNFRSDQVDVPRKDYFGIALSKLKVAAISIFALLLSKASITKVNAQTVADNNKKIPADEKSTVKKDFIVYNFTGNVVTRKDSDAMASVLITVHKNGNVIAEGYTDNEGNFTIYVETENDTLGFNVVAESKHYRNYRQYNYIPTIEGLTIEMKKKPKRSIRRLLRRKHHKGYYVRGAMFFFVAAAVIASNFSPV